MRLQPAAQELNRPVLAVVAMLPCRSPPLLPSSRPRRRCVLVRVRDERCRRTATLRATELLTTRGGGHDAATAGRTGAEPSRARRGRVAGVALSAGASIVSAKKTARAGVGA